MNVISRDRVTPKPLDRFSKSLAPLIKSATRLRAQIFGSVGSKRAWLRMREFVAVRPLFFTKRQHSLLRRAMYQLRSDVELSVRLSVCLSV